MTKMDLERIPATRVEEILAALHYAGMMLPDPFYAGSGIRAWYRHSGSQINLHRRSTTPYPYWSNVLKGLGWLTISLIPGLLSYVTRKLYIP